MHAISFYFILLCLVIYLFIHCTLLYIILFYLILYYGKHDTTSIYPILFYFIILYFTALSYCTLLCFLSYFILFYCTHSLMQAPPEGVCAALVTEAASDLLSSMAASPLSIADAYLDVTRRKLASPLLFESQASTTKPSTWTTYVPT